MSQPPLRGSRVASTAGSSGGRHRAGAPPGGVPIVLPIFGFFVFGVFSGHAVYFPELFPTQIRSTGVAFCNGAARIITSFGPLIAGLLAAALGGFSVAAAIMVCFALLSVVAMLMGRETRGRELPH